MSAQHTPGPWKVDVRKGEASIQTQTTNEILHLSPTSAEGCVQFEANVRLIAAAPELLVALRAALTYLGTDATDDSAEARDTRIVVRAAIARAEG